MELKTCNNKKCTKITEIDYLKIKLKWTKRVSVNNGTETVEPNPEIAESGNRAWKWFIHVLNFMWYPKLICFKLRFPFGISSAWLPRFMIRFLLLCEFIIKHLILINCINTPCCNLFQNYSLVHFRVHICCLERSNVAAAHTRDFSSAESNVNELEQRILIICIGSAHEMFDVSTRPKIYDASSSTTRPSKLYNYSWCIFTSDLRGESYSLTLTLAQTLQSF